MNENVVRALLNGEPCKAALGRFFVHFGRNRFLGLLDLGVHMAIMTEVMLK
ncbi:hypothetical protein MKY87_26480 [Paenibacillus sp. FSL R7-0198]|uniref:hypothetical protein n=1 Tax=Paenibacillus sp. FSL R7-0198 TaxID=2921674 RepID=UPI0030FB6257